MNFPLLSGHYIDTTDFMSDNTPESNQDSGSATSSETKSFSDKYSDVMGKVNETLGMLIGPKWGNMAKRQESLLLLLLHK